MLSFYLLADEVPKPRPTQVAELLPAGQLSEESFTQLQQARLLESRLNYYTDFRWSSAAVQVKLQLLLQRFPQLRPTATPTATPEQQLLLILLNASAQSFGIIALAD